MKHPILTSVAALCLVAACASCSSPNDGPNPEVGDPSDVASVVDALSTPSAYGVIAAPPLPTAVPSTVFDPARDIADVDGSTVVTAEGGLVRFVSGASVPPWFEVGLGAELRAVSGNGEHAALFERSAGWSLITVISAAGSAEDRKEYRLPGLVEPEAFSTDGSTLFVIDHQVASTAGAYRVRPLDLATGELATILGPTKVPFDDDMNGVGRRQVWSPDGTRLYTLYIRQTHHHHDAESTDGGGEPSHGGHGEEGTDGFVHVLDLDEEWAFCLDLPEEFGGGSLDSTALAVSPLGDVVAVADFAAGQIAFADTDALDISRVTSLPTVQLDTDLQIALTAESLALGTGREVWWFDRATMIGLSSTPTLLDAPLSAFTSNSDAVLAWTTDVGDGPTTLAEPR